MGHEQNLDVITDEQIEHELGGMPGWSRQGIAIVKNYEFDSFIEAMAFVNRVAAVANELDHHPDMTISYSDVGMRIWTHKKNAITRADIILARKIDEVEWRQA